MRRRKGSLLLISILFVLALVIVIWLVGGKTEGMASNSDTCISKVIIQTSRDSPPSQTVLDNFKAMMPDDWTYQHFTDADIKQFFLENPLDEFPDIQAKFDAMPYGQHKADLFRYYYIYAKGGVFVDSDARIEQPIDQLCQDVSFFSVRSKVPETIFQGFIGACPQNEIMYRVLKHAYTTDPSELAANYHLLTGELYRILENEKFDFKIKLFQEEDKEYEPDGHYKTFDMDTGKLVLIHYPMSKNVPPLGT